MQTGPLPWCPGLEGVECDWGSLGVVCGVWSRVRDWMAYTKSCESKVRFLNLFFHLYILFFSYSKVIHVPSKKSPEKCKRENWGCRDDLVGKVPSAKS